MRAAGGGILSKITLGRSKMKKIRIISAVLALVIALISLASCSGSTPVMTISDGTVTKTIDLNVYTFLLSRMRGTLSFYDYDTESDRFWRTVISNDGTTYDDHFSSTIFEQTKRYLMIEYLFETEGLTLDASREAKVNATMDGLLKKAGSKTALNSELKGFGVNYEMLRDIYIIEQKYSQIMEYYYGKDGEKISELEKNKYYAENYVAFGQIYLPTYEVLTGADGKEGTAAYDDEKKAEIAKKAKEYASACNGDIEVFKEYSRLYSDTADSGEPTYLFVQAEYYGLQSASAAYLDRIAATLSDMTVGEVRVIESPYGYHVICRYAREDHAYDNERYKESFSDFNAMLSDKLFGEKCEGLDEYITVDYDVARPKISEVATNKLY